MKKRPITAKHAQALHGEIRQRDDIIAQQGREIQHAQDALREEKVRAVGLQIALDEMAVKLEKMGEQVGAVNLREMAAREVAATALHGMAAVASAVQCGVSTTQIAVTLRSLERDGREQLKRATNGGHA